jgi:hypothetical protein
VLQNITGLIAGLFSGVKRKYFTSKLQAPSSSTLVDL